MYEAVCRVGSVLSLRLDVSCTNPPRAVYISDCMPRAQGGITEIPNTLGSGRGASKGDPVGGIRHNEGGDSNSGVGGSSGGSGEAVPMKTSIRDFINDWKLRCMQYCKLLPVATPGGMTEEP